MIVSGRIIGLRKPLFEDWVFTFDDPSDLTEQEWTLGKLVALLVFEQIDYIAKGSGSPEFLAAMNIVLKTNSGIDSSTEVTLDASPISNPTADQAANAIDGDLAVESAMEAYENDVFVVSVDDQDVMELDEPIELTSDSRISIVRLVPLM